MKAIGFKENLDITNENALQDIEMPKPKAKGRDLLVEVKAISVNPVDYKIRKNRTPEDGNWEIIGWDASGIVKEVGEDVSLFKVGDEVWYAGELKRQGSNAEFQLVDERIVGNKPSSLSFADAAALPLTSLTAWEMLFDRVQVSKEDSNKSILIVGAGGGVGSIMVQLAKKLTRLKVIGTASRDVTKNWLKDLGADVVIDHSNNLSEEFEKENLPEADYVIGINATGEHFEEIVKVINPQGKFGFIDDPKVINATSFKPKSVSIHYELMFTRSLFKTPDMIEQHHSLNKVSELIDDETLKTTKGEHFGTINAENLRKAHQLLESGKAKGKIVLEGF
ncbi:zinc-binding alcohol dehydrogenase family protein [Psychroflexus sp. YR1-1]|uniref:Zinc-type alcohol dehydrogenase-like protein n=1 Tax=Psychroflexus aurantiacus TaxID=2709310 RepID=A0A6B3R1Y7_9FLAO|nr:zinc-binding alcohol dehydrogenase family protein [Psychroflexus aurantiacus]NEV92655.1 zinc-binding alcohol dehydrogenase family protein [Psychroflexus aurantiacus]